MDVDRRALLSLLGLMQPALFTYGVGAAAAQGWRSFRSNFGLDDGRIVDTGNGGVSHSEGQGYGMLLAEAADDKRGFDALWSWTAANLQRRADHLFSWRYDPGATSPITDPNNATDGDILLAWALLRGGRRWRDAGYLKASEDIRASILRLLIKPLLGRTVILPGLSGFEQPGSTVVNPSYYVWPALDAFRLADPGGVWGDVIGDGMALIEKARFGPCMITCDWVEIQADGYLAPARGRHARFGYDAIRVPLYLAWSNRAPALAPYIAFWRSLRSQGRQIPAWLNVEDGSAADYPLDSGGLAIVALVLGRIAAGPEPATSDYYSGALSALSALAAREAGAGSPIS